MSAPRASSDPETATRVGAASTKTKAGRGCRPVLLGTPLWRAVSAETSWLATANDELG